MTAVAVAALLVSPVTSAAAASPERELAAYVKKVDQAGVTAAKSFGGVETTPTMGWGAYKLQASDTWFVSFIYGMDSQYATIGSPSASALQAYRDGAIAQLQRDGLQPVGSRSFDTGSSSIYAGVKYTCAVTDGMNFFGEKNSNVVCAPTAKVRTEQKKVRKLVRQYEKAAKKSANGLTFTESTLKSAVKKYKKYKKTYLHAVNEKQAFYLYYAKAPGKSAKYVTQVKANKQHTVKCKVLEKKKATSRAFAKEPCKRGKKRSSVKAR